MKTILRKINLALGVLVFALIACLAGFAALSLALLTATLEYLHLRKKPQLPEYSYYVEAP